MKISLNEIYRNPFNIRDKGSYLNIFHYIPSCGKCHEILCQLHTRDGTRYVCMQIDFQIIIYVLGLFSN